ncbi:unnamed protein product (macronuclear) [Paramecium tetraurelia]|uniref:Uncharacterized protein n=1 Tax=Paramecium tetraurelia TaxID=5888 RepID=A0EGK9_PARTE|nr:uncharacterized protein GSPATT00026774001 [Paramecium tetraurelia]CAK94450.1 unnamed protein product [Paramecium tetraurelia]|eukprot:XP_001461823.1 hypothetical protein (macronuclear) [Paramecium tetraurelia strain d4-2]
MVFWKEKYGFLTSQIIKHLPSDDKKKRAIEKVDKIVNNPNKNIFKPKDLYFTKADYLEFLEAIEEKQLIPDTLDSIRKRIGEYTIKEDDSPNQDLIKNILQRSQAILMKGPLQCKYNELKQIRIEIDGLYKLLQGKKKLVHKSKVRSGSKGLNEDDKQEEKPFNLTDQEAIEQEEEGQQMSWNFYEQKYRQTQQVDYMNDSNNILGLHQTDEMINDEDKIIFQANDYNLGQHQTDEMINDGVRIIFYDNDNNLWLN